MTGELLGLPTVSPIMDAKEKDNTYNLRPLMHYITLSKKEMLIQVNHHQNELGVKSGHQKKASPQHVLEFTW